MELFNDALTMRLSTVERNIKSKSNSFYDSFLDLLEATIKYILDENNIQYDESRTCGHLVRNVVVVKSFFLDSIKVDAHTYEKVSDYIKKCNDHKHKKEKVLGVESVVKYLQIYFAFINYYADYNKSQKCEFKMAYYVSIFGETERLNNQYKGEVSKLKEELKDSYEAHKLSEQNLEQYKSLLSIKDIELLNLEDQNGLLQEQINTLKDIKISSMEEKLNKTIDLLNELGASVMENRAIQYAVGDTICGQELFEKYVEKAKSSMPAAKKVIDSTNSYVEKGVNAVNTINTGIEAVENVINIFKGKN